MGNSMTRRTFTGALAVAAIPAVVTAGDEERDYPAPKFKPSFKKPQTGKLLVQDFVIYAHSELPMVEKLLAKDATLVYATQDWGGGDWESALGAAAHMGRRDIAEFLLDRGARIDIFCAVMLGHLDAVKVLLTAHPKLIDAKGPHGISLVNHAKAGKAEAKPVLEYLESLKPKVAEPGKK